MMKTLEGMIAPKFSLKNEKGEIVSLDDFAGKNMLFCIFTQKIRRQDVQQKHVISEIPMRNLLN